MQQVLKGFVLVLMAMFIIANAGAASASSSLQVRVDQAAESDPRLAAIVRDNQEAANETARVRAAQEHVSDVVGTLKVAIKELRAIKESDERRVLLAGSGSDPITEVLLRHRDSLPPLANQRRDLEAARTGAATAEIERLDAAEDLASAERTDEAVEALIADQPTGHATAAELAPLFRQRADQYLRPLVSALTSYSAILAEEVTVRSEYTELLEQYRNFIDTHLLWLPDMPVIGERDVRGVTAHVGRYATRPFWGAIGEDLVDSFRFRPFRWIGGAVLVLALALIRGRGFRFISKTPLPGSSTEAGLVNIGSAVLESVILAAPIPLALQFAGQLIESTPAAATAAPFGSAMHSVAGYAFLISFALALSAHGGAGERQLGWSLSTMTSIRRAMLALAAGFLPAIFVAQASLNMDGIAGSEEIARWAVIVALLVLTAVSARIFRPSHGVFSGVIAANPTGLISILRPVWYSVCALLPAVLALGAAAGYVITAITVIENIARSYWVILLLAVGISALGRIGGAALDRFDLAGQLEAREEARFEDQLRSFGRLLLALVTVAGLAWAWNDLIPAFGIVSNMAVWTVAAGEGSARVPVSVRDAVFCVATVVVTMSLVRDLPGIINIVILRRFPIDRSARYALVALGRYLIVVTGIIVALACLRIRWNDVQWLAAAVTVGLGFGLQEIFANFVSGLILLAERPVRIGDLVTIDGISGRVSRIAARATTIVDFDNKDVIIPNKQLITGKITNWTLQESSVRVTIRVSVEADADLDSAVAGLREAAAGSAGVIANPGPEVLLVGFTSGSADIDVSIYVARPGELQPARHDLVGRSKRILAERGIAIAIPQMDVHVRGAPSFNANATQGAR